MRMNSPILFRNVSLPTPRMMRLAGTLPPFLYPSKDLDAATEQKRNTCGKYEWYDSAESRPAREQRLPSAAVAAREHYS